MNALPDRAVVLGSGAGALSIAGELSLAGVDTTLADFERFRGGLAPVAAAGGVALRCDFHGSEIVPVRVSEADPPEAIEEAPLVIVSVPCFGHEPFATALAPAVQDGQTVLWVGEGGGAFSMVAALRVADRRPELKLGETNSLPYGARVVAPGTVRAVRKSGGTLVAGLPAHTTAEVFAMANELWPWTTAAQSPWETLLVNFNAIDHVPAVLCNVGTIEGRRGPMLLWGEGATRGVVRLIEGVDAELITLRASLGLEDRTRYGEFLVAQGFAPDVGGDLYETMRSSSLMTGVFHCGPDALDHRYITEDVPYSYLMAASIGDELGVETPLIDALATVASTVVGRDLSGEGRTLATWGLDGAGPEGLRRAVEDGWW
jgi:opine dehydrogenase